MKLRWTRPALADLIEAQSYIARDDLAAAEAVAQRVWDAANKLRENPEMGRQGHVAETREWIVSSTPYLLVYRVKNDAIEVLRVWHGRRKWQNNLAG